MFDPHKRFDVPFDIALKELLEAREMSVRGLAAILQDRFDGWGSVSTISLYNQGKLKPTLEAMERIAIGLEVEPRVFCEFRLGMARNLLDPEKVGLSMALHYLDQFEARA